VGREEGGTDSYWENEGCRDLECEESMRRAGGSKVFVRMKI